MRRRDLRLPVCALAVLLALGAPSRPAVAATDPGASKQWGMSLIGADAARQVGTGAGTVIAVVDSGADLAHEDLAAKLLPGTNFVSPGTPPQDDNGHGTHVAGIAAASTNNGRGVAGVAAEARILPVKVLDRGGRGSYEDAAAAIRWSVDAGATVVNLSLGSTVAALFGTPSVFTDAIRYAWSKGVICVVAAGNDFVLSSDFADEPAIVVSATTRTDGKPSYSSGVGDARWGLSAPGGSGGTLGSQENDILSTYWEPGKKDVYAYNAGTSMAAPHVAGAVAVLRSRGLSPQAAVDRLLATAVDIGPRGRDATFGAGRLDLARAVTGLGRGGTSPTSSPPAPTTRRSPATTAAPGTASPPAGAASTTVAPQPSSPDLPAPATTETTSDLQVVAPREEHRERPDGSNRSRPWLPAAAALAALAAAATAVVRTRRHL